MGQDKHNKMIIDSNRIEEIFYNLVNIKSDTGTILEKDIEDYIYEWIGNLKYFKDNIDKYGEYNLEEDYLNRSVVWALIKGEGSDTIVLMHHHDVVDSLDYGNLAEYAYNPKKLHKEMKNVELPQETKQDLESCKWIFGRGTCDMKAGAAIQMALVEKYSKVKNLKGNILLLSVPDEESLSAGMRGAAKLLQGLKEKFNICYELLINSEPHEREQNNKGYLYEGSVGKLMPIIYVRGKKTHIGSIFEGFNPVLLLSEIVRRIELNIEFSDIVNGEVTPPPTWIYCRDMKERYDVSVPNAAGGYFSILTLKSTPEEIINKLKILCEDAFNKTINNMNKQYKSYIGKKSGEEKMLPWKVKVSTFSELYEEALRDSGKEFLKAYDDTINRIRIDIEGNKISMPDSSFVLIERTLRFVKDLAPRVVIAFSPPYYPHISNRDFKELSEPLLNLSQEISELSQRLWNVEYKKCNYFMGISDMSYAAINNISEIIPYIAPNMPLWEKIYNIPFKTIEKISMPSINIGPWGKDLHKFTERVFREDLFERTPLLVEYAIDRVLK